MSKRIFGKILLFGEYSILYGGNALSVPFKSFSGILKLHASSEFAKASNVSIKDFAIYLEANFSSHFGIEDLQHALTEGLYFDSNIPQGYGAGSSGALVAALLHGFGKNIPESLLKKKELFGAIESYFHGSSSGLDVLVCYEETAILLSDGIPRAITLDRNPLLSDFFVLDSHQIGITSDMVNQFRAVAPDVEQAFKQVYVDSSNKCIESFLMENADELGRQMEVLSNFTWNHLPFTIPQAVGSVWKESLSSPNATYKLCGSGGGGFTLGFGKSTADSCIPVGL